jgi:acyl-CoA thioesterase I
MMTPPSIRRPIKIAAVATTIAAVLLSYNSYAYYQQAASTSPAPSQLFKIRPASPSDIRYVAVGDSYTIGTGALGAEAWPEVLTRSLQSKGIKISLVANLGVNGWRTEDAIENELPIYDKATPQFATLMIGVNDTYTETTPGQFRARFCTLLDHMIDKLPQRSKIVAIDIPDFTVTPTGANYASASAVKKIGEFNAIIKEESAKRKVPVVDVTALSRHMGSDQTLMAQDRLHPSAKEYAIWARQIEPTALGVLKTGS